MTYSVISLNDRIPKTKELLTGVSEHGTQKRELPVSRATKIVMFGVPSSTTA